jgi:hypothetical protein
MDIVHAQNDIGNIVSEIIVSNGVGLSEDAEPVRRLSRDSFSPNSVWISSCSEDVTGGHPTIRKTQR